MKTSKGLDAGHHLQAAKVSRSISVFLKEKVMVNLNIEQPSLSHVRPKMTTAKLQSFVHEC